MATGDRAVRPIDNLTCMVSSEYLDMHAVADRLGLSYKTIRGYHTKASRRRREQDSRPGDFPAPDAIYGGSPVWEPATVDAWLARRPGQGAGGGRPSHRGKEDRR